MKETSRNSLWKLFCVFLGVGIWVASKRFGLLDTPWIFLVPASIAAIGIGLVDRYFEESDGSGSDGDSGKNLEKTLRRAGTLVKWFVIILLCLGAVALIWEMFQLSQAQKRLSGRALRQKKINKLAKIESGQLVPNSLLALVPNEVDQCRFQFRGNSVEYGREIEGEKVKRGDTLVVEWEPSWVPEGDMPFGIFALTDSFGNVYRWRVIQYGEETPVSFEENDFLIFRGILFNPKAKLKVLNTCSFATIRKTK